MLDSDSDGDEGDGRPGKRGRRPTKTEGYGGGEGVDHGRGREELRASEALQYPAERASGRSRSMSRSRDRDDRGNVDAREKTHKLDATEPEVALRREMTGPGLRKGDPKDRGPD